MENAQAPRINYTYFAFISYKREDEKWARWLKNQLQRYRVPISTRRRNRMLPRQCKPIFMDKTNLNPGLLDEGLQSEVQDSRFIIVICSRHARAESKYLDAELQYFLDNGGDLSRVIPFVVEQAEDVVAECFPSLLAKICTEQQNIVGANIFDDGKQMAVIKTVAAMLGLKREELESDDLRRRKRQRFLAAVAGVLAVIALYMGWDYYWPKSAYYLDYTEVYGVPVGIGRLEEREIASLPGHYTIVTSQRKVRELRYENSTGSLQEHSAPEHFDFSPRKLYSYRDNELDTVQVQDKTEKTLYSMSYKGRSTADLDGIPGASDESGIAQSVGLAGQTAFNPLEVVEANSNKSNIMRYYYLFDEQGHPTEIRYASDTWNYAGMDADGISGLRFQLDELGRVVQMEYLTFVGGAGGTIDKDSNFAVVGKKNGVAGMEFSYEDNDLTTIRSFDVHHNSTSNEGGYSICTADFSEHQLKALHYARPDGQPVLNTLGYACAQREYDGQGNQIRERYLGTDAQSVLCSSGYAAWESEYDQEGNRTAISYFGTDGQPVLCKDGFSSAKAQYDRHRNQIKVSCYDTDGQPVLCRNGYCSAAAEYDEHGNRLRVSYSGTDGVPVLHIDGNAGWKAEYDSRGNQISQTFFGISRRSVLCKDGYAQCRAEYDPRGNQVKVSYFGTDGQPITGKRGFAGWETEYDSRGNAVKVSYFGTDGQPVMCSEAYAGWESEYDSRGNQVKVSYFGTEHQPVVCDEGYSVWKAEYDQRGNQVRLSYFNEDDLPVMCSEGYSLWRAEYDERGNQIRVSYYDTDRQPVLCGDGYFCAQSEYDERNNQVRVRYLDVDGKPILHNDGNAGWEAGYDELGNRVRMSWFGTDEEPVLCRDGYAGWALVLDERGQAVRLSYFGTDQAPILCTEGYAVAESEYDARGNQIRERYFGTDGAPILINDGTAGWESSFNTRGNRIRVSYFGTDGLPILRKDGFSSAVFDYDPAGNLVSCRLYDEKGNLIDVI